MIDWVIGVAGGISAGKSTFVSALSAETNAAVTGFGAYVRDEALKSDLDVTSRDVLQALGEKLKNDLGAPEFVRRVLLRATPSDGRVIVDGVRHVEVAEALELASAPRRFVLVFLEADEQTRTVRSAARAADALRLRELASHSTELQVHDGSLRARASLILDARCEVGELVAITCRHLKGMQASAHR